MSLCPPPRLLGPSPSRLEPQAPGRMQGGAGHRLLGAPLSSPHSGPVPQAPPGTLDHEPRPGATLG